MKKLLIVTLILLSILLVVNVNAAQVVVPTDVALDATANENANIVYGTIIHMNSDYELKNITFGSDNQCNYAEVYNMTGETETLFNNTAMGSSNIVEYADDSIHLAGGKFYFIGCGNTSNFKTHRHLTTAGLPIAKSELTWTSSGRIEAGTLVNFTEHIWAVLSVGLSNDTAAPLTPTPAIFFNTTWNISSANNLKENNNTWPDGTVNISSNLLSFTVQTNITSNMSCSIGNDLNYTAMVSLNANYKAATTDTVQHAYTVYDNISIGSNCLYCSLLSSPGNLENGANSTTGCLSIRRYDYVNVTLVAPADQSTAIIDTVVNFNFSGRLLDSE